MSLHEDEIVPSTDVYTCSPAVTNSLTLKKFEQKHAAVTLSWDSKTNVSILLLSYIKLGNRIQTSSANA